MTAVDEMTLSIFSDIWKDAYGFRPSADVWTKVRAMGAAEFACYFEGVKIAAADRAADEERAERVAATKYEAHIAAIMRDHGVDRATAIRWDMQAHGTDDREYYCWQLGLPYRYFERAA